MRKITLSILAILALCSNAQSQNKPANPDSALQSILDGLKGSELKLGNAVDIALEHSTVVRTARAQAQSAHAAVRRERGVFDPVLFMNVNYEDIQAPTASFFSGAPVLGTTETNAQSGLRWDLPIGTAVELSLNMIRLSTNSNFAFLNPQYTAFGNLSFRQPLLGGLKASGRKGLTNAERTAEAAEARYEQQALIARSEVERRYWELYAAERDYAVRRLTLEQGEAFLRETELRAQAGLVGPNQVASARTFLAEQKLLILDREEELDRLSDELASYIGERPETEARFRTADTPKHEFSVEDVDVLLEKALTNNSDLKAAQSDIEAARTLAKAAGWEALPRVDLIGSFGGNGLAGTAQEVIFGSDTLRTNRGGTLGDAFSQVTSRDFKTWNIGIEMSIPIGFRGGLGERERLRAEVIVAEQHYLEQARDLEAQIRQNHRELVHGGRRLQAATEGVEAAQEQVRIGLIEFQNGRTTAFELVRLGADFALAQQRYSDALVRTARAAATLKQLTSGSYTGSTPN